MERIHRGAPATLVLAATAALIAILLLVGEATIADEVRPGQSVQQMKLWKEIDISQYKGSFPCLGDLDGDGKVDLLLYRQGAQTTPGYMAAMSHDGKALWEMGDPSIQTHVPDGVWKEPALRGIALIYDIERDGKSEVITEFWTDGKPMLYVLDGATGKIREARESPLDLKVRGGRRSRCHPVGRIAFLRGRDEPPALVMIYGASGFVPCHAVALDAGLQTLWHLAADGKAMAHMPTVGDVDGDGRDEILCGTLLADEDGKVVWEKKYLNHADCTAILPRDDKAEKAVLLSICNTGPAACLSAGGETLWEKTRGRSQPRAGDLGGKLHRQGTWPGGRYLQERPPRRVPDRPGKGWCPTGYVPASSGIGGLPRLSLRRELEEQTDPVALDTD